MVAILLVLPAAAPGAGAPAPPPAPAPAPAQATSRLGFAQFKHRRWIAEDGAPTLIRSIAQTRDGFLWLASADGLHRFDGVTFERIEPPRRSTIGRVIPSTLLVGGTGDLWVGYAQGGGVAVYRNGRWRDTHMPDPPTHVTSLVETPDGAIWASAAGASRPLWRFAHGRWRRIAADSGLPAGDILKLGVTHDGTLWAPVLLDGVAGSTLVSLSFGSARFRIYPQRLGWGARTAVDRQGNLWGTDDAGARLLIDRRGGAPRHPIAFPPVPGTRFAALAFDAKGGVWGSTLNAGAFYIPDALRPARTDGDGPRRFLAQDGLTSNGTTASFVDREDNVWIGTETGLDQFRPASVLYEPAIPNDPVDGYSIARDHTGAVYFTSTRTLFVADPGRPPRAVAPLPADFRSLCPARDGGVWALTRSRIIRLKGTDRSEQALPGNPGFASNCVEDRLGQLWISMLGTGPVLWRDARGWRRLQDAPGQAPAFEVAATGDGDVAFRDLADTFGIIRGSRRTIHRLPSAIAGRTTMLGSIGDDIYLGGSDAFVRIRAGRPQWLTADRFPWIAGMRGIAGTVDGDIWLLGYDGLSRIRSDALDRAFSDPAAPLPRRLFGNADGLTSKIQHWLAGNDIAIGGDGRIWIATRSGIFFVDPATLPRNRLPPPVIIRSLASDGAIHRTTPASVLPAGTHAIEIAYTAPSLVVPERVRFRYRLEGVDRDWVEAGNRRLANYGNLGPGDYRFQVIAANEDGVWNDRGAALAFSIEPSFTQSWPFRLLCAATVLALLWLVYALRLRAVTRGIRARAAERVAERERIARDLHDTLLQSVQALTLRFQLAVDELPDGASTRAMLEDAIDQADRTIAEGRDRLRDLRPPSEDRPLADIIAAIVDKHGFGPATTVSITTQGAARRLDPVAAEEIVRIADEAIFNIRRHAAARMISVELSFGSEFGLRLADDGVGIDPATLATGGRPGHFGMRGMHERAQKLRGGLDIHARAGGGTAVVLTVPGSVAYARATPRPKPRPRPHG